MAHRAGGGPDMQDRHVASLFPAMPELGVFSRPRLHAGQGLSMTSRALHGMSCSAAGHQLVQVESRTKGLNKGHLLGYDNLWVVR